jgi:hypothetical protein
METIEKQFGKLCFENRIGDKDKTKLWQWIKINDDENILLSKYCNYLKSIIDKTDERYLEFGVWAIPFTNSNNTGNDTNT